MPPEHLERPLVADRYRLDSVIGSGGVGRVWRGEDTVLRRAVAIKEVPLPAHLPDDEREALRARVLREAQAAARIHHPGSVQVFDVVDDEDTVHLVMELVEERTLADVVDGDGPLAPQATAAIGVELLGALEAAHAVGIVHRDVKPRNVMVLPSGGVKLADFGVASLRDDPSITKTGMILGTPSYMSPEQATGGAVGVEADVWGTGALLYFAVEGEAPFDRGEPIATLHAVVHGDARPYQRAGPLTAVLDQLLVKDPSARISLADAKARLEAIARGGDDTRAVAMADATSVTPAAATALSPAAPRARPTTGAPPPRRPPARPSPNRSLPLAIAAVVAILVIGGIALAGQDGDDDPGGADPDAAPATEEAEGDTEDPNTTAPTDGDTAEEEQQEDAAATTAPPDDETGERPDGVPGSWKPYTDPSIGWAIWHPPSWQPTDASGNAIDFRDPSSGAYLRVDHVQPPSDDPVAAWEESSARFAERYPDYEELRIEATTYQGHDAAIWEYTYEGQRASNLGFVTPGIGFALNFQTSASAWDGTADLRRGFEAGFTVPD